MASQQSLWRGVRTAVTVTLTAGLSVAGLAWFLHKHRSAGPKDESKKDERPPEEEQEQIQEEEVDVNDGQEEDEQKTPINEGTAPSKGEEEDEERTPVKRADKTPQKEAKVHQDEIEENKATKMGQVSKSIDLEDVKENYAKVEEGVALVMKASGDQIKKKKIEGEPQKVKKGKSVEVPKELEISPKIAENNDDEASQPEKSPEIPIKIKSLRIDSADKKRVLVLGLDRAGKSTFVSALCGRPIQAEYAPTQGFAVVTTTIGNKALNFWEVGGALNLRQHWDHYVDGTLVLVYIIDSSSFDTVNVAKVELLSLVETNKHLETIPWLIIASKQDVPGAMNPEELRESLNIPQVPKKPEKIVLGMELPAKGLKKGISQVKNYFTLTDF